MRAEGARPANHHNSSPIPREKIAKGIRYFLVLTVAGMAVIFYTSSTPQTFAALRHLDLRYILLACVLQFFDVWLGGLRNHVLLRKFKSNVTPWLTFRAQLANEFGAAVTPGQSGGLPAWLYILKRGGISSASAMAVSVTVFLSTLIFFELATSLSLMALGDRFSQGAFGYILRYGFIVCTALLVLVLFSAWMPERMQRFLYTRTRRWSLSRKKLQVRIATVANNIVSGIEQYQKSLKHFMGRDRRAVMQAFALSSVYYFGKLNLAYLIILGLGAQVDYVSAMAVLAVLRFVLYFSPTPGGSGVGEISIAALMSIILPAYMLPIYTILYRAFHLYLPATFGAMVLFKDLRNSDQYEERWVKLPQNQATPQLNPGGESCS